MDYGLFKKLNLEAFLKNSSLLHPVKEHYPDFLSEILEFALSYWYQGETEKANEQIKMFNAQIGGFQIGTLIELAININNVDSELSLKVLNEVPPSALTNSDVKLLYHALKAVLYLYQWDIDEARNECDEVIQIDPKFKIVYYVRALCYALREVHDKAIPDYKIALGAGYKKEEVIANLAYSYLRTNQYRKALQLFKQVADKFPSNDKIQYNTGLCYAKFRKYSKSVNYFNQAISLNPENGGYKLTRGHILMKLGKYFEAESDLTQAFNSGKDIAGNLLKINASALTGKINTRGVNKKVLQMLRNYRGKM